jgi:hypothetical protein
MFAGQITLFRAEDLFWIPSYKHLAALRPDKHPQQEQHTITPRPADHPIAANQRRDTVQPGLTLFY